MPGPYGRLVVILIRTSKYDDDGYVVRHWRGTLPSNTLSCLNSLTEDVVRSGELGAIEVRVDVIDEIVSRVDPAALGRRYRRDGTKVVVGLVGVQINQFPRAPDLARQFKTQGFDVIIDGFPCDKYERVMEDVRTLRETLHVDQASFFMLAPIPGSRDHQTAVRAGAALDPDYNNYDSFHATAPHPRMSKQEWERAFHDAWVEFYSFEHMRRSLLAQNPHTYWAVLKNLIWYRAGMIEGAHPMITGFFRLKDRCSRRPGFPIERRWPFARRRACEMARLVRDYVRLYLEMRELWMLTRIRREDYWFLGDLRGLAPRSVQAAKLTWGRVHVAVALRLASMQERLGVGADILSATMTERLDAMREVLGSRGAGVTGPMVGRADATGAAIEAVRSGTGVVDPARLVESALADLRLPELPAAPSRASLRSRVTRLNPLSLDQLDYDPALDGYWRRTRGAIARLDLRRLNPVALTSNLVRGIRQSLGFLVAMHGERY